MPDIVTIAGSPSAPSRSAAVLDYVRGMLHASGLSSEAISVRDLPAEALIHGEFNHPTVQEAQALISSARGLVIATPIYKAAYAGVLKTFLDILPANALAGKTVLPLATGGAPVHFLAIDYALRPVLVALNATWILNGVYIIDSQIQQTAEGVRFEASVGERLDAAIQQLATSLNGAN